MTSQEIEGNLHFVSEEDIVKVSDELDGGITLVFNSTECQARRA